MHWWIPGLSREHRAAVAARMGELPPIERRRRLERAKGEARRDPRFRVSMIFALVTFLAWWGILISLPARPTAYQHVIALTATAAAGVATVYWAITSGRLADRKLAAEFPTLCPACGYDRRANPGRCPECGTESPAAPDVGT